MKVAKLFRWDAAHRLPLHDGDCRFLHGHSYGMTVALEGRSAAEDGMLVDFKDIKNALKPLIDKLDHATLACDTDVELVRMVRSLNSKLFLFPYETTAENIAKYACDFVIENCRELLAERQVSVVIVRIQETETSYAEHSAAVPNVSEYASHQQIEHPADERP